MPKQSRKPRSLTPMGHRFKAEYIKDGNGTQAAIRAGYSPNSAANRAAVLLKHPDIKKYMDEFSRERERLLKTHLHVTTKATLQEMARISYFDPRRLMRADGTCKSVNELDDDVAAAIKGFEVHVEWVTTGKGENARRQKIVTTSYELHNKVAALDQAAKITGEYAKDNAQRRPARELSDDELMDRITALTTKPVGDEDASPPNQVVH